MKNGKLLGGCLLVAVLVLAVGGGAVYWIVLRPLWQGASALMDTAQQWQQVAQLEQQVRNRTPFNEPAEGRIDAAQVAAFVEVQQAMADRLGDRWQQLEAKYRELKADQQRDGREPGVQDMFVAYAELSGLIVEAKRAQVEALNDSGLSLDEYRWIRAQSFAALGLAAQDATPPAFAGTSLQANAELLRPHRELLVKTAASAWLGF
jgi:hypothetical protein